MSAIDRGNSGDPLRCGQRLADMGFQMCEAAWHGFRCGVITHGGKYVVNIKDKYHGSLHATLNNATSYRLGSWQIDIDPNYLEAAQ